MDLLLQKSEIIGAVEIPPSKSLAHRIMIASFLAGENYDFGLKGEDVEATKDCLDSLKRLFDGETQIATLDARESGSTLRFLLPIVCALDVNAEFLGRGRLPNRPIGELVDALKAHGANLMSDRLPLRVASASAETCLAKKGLTAGKYVVNGGVSSQYITGLLFALPLLEGDSEIEIVGELVSKSYVELTLSVLEAFGVQVAKTENGFAVKGGQKYKIERPIAIEGDWSSACFPLSLGLLTGEVRVKGLDERSKQADRVFFDAVKRMGGDIRFENGDAVAKKSALKAIDFDAKDCPDVVPILSTLLAFAEGTSKIHGVDRLKIKESDRLFAVQTTLEKLGVKTEYFDDTLVILGKGDNLKLENDVEIDGFFDHRIAMSGIVAGLKLGGIKVKGVECIQKSYPTFVMDMAGIGAQARQED